VLSAAVEGARRAVADTPNLLPVLKEAGVVDSGGQGLQILLEGAFRALSGEQTAGEALPLPEAGTIREDWQPALDAAHGSGSTFGYCTEFLVAAVDADLDAVRPRLEAIGDSVIVVADSGLLRAHLHTDEPGVALAVGTSLGRLRNVKVDDMQAQYTAAFGRAANAPARPAAPVAVVAVAAGRGLVEVLRSVGAVAVVEGGQTMNPSAQDILDAAHQCGSADVIVLPNNKNIEMAARQAAGLSECTLHVVSTRSVPQGIAALLAFDRGASAADNVDHMTTAAAAVRTIEVTYAVRAATVNGVATKPGDAIALVDDELCVACDSLSEAAMRALEVAGAAGCSLATIYHGEGADEAEARGLAERIGGVFPDLEVEVVDGGQPHYPFILSLE
jgi:DAK2 domain fusion protein YloV